MNEKPSDSIQAKIEDELAFARALTALTMAISMDINEIQSNRVEFRLKAKHHAIESELNRLAS